MNFLGHLYFSQNNTDLMAANLFGDFVKGKDLNHYQPIVQQGIRLHRSIDSYIDHHPDVLELMHVLYQPLPKVAGIAIDLYFDHLLAKNWSNYHSLSLEDFIDNFYHSFQSNHPDYSPHFLSVMEKMIQKNWLYQYQFQHGLYKACQGVSSRLSFQNKLVDGLEVFIQNEELITKTFEKYMIDATIFFHQNVLE